MRLDMQYLRHYLGHFGWDCRDGGMFDAGFGGTRRMIFAKKGKYRGASSVTNAERFEHKASQNIEESEQKSADVYAEKLGREIVERGAEHAPELSHIMVGIRRKFHNTVGDIFPEGLKEAMIQHISRDPELLEKYPKMQGGKGFFKELGTLFAPRSFKRRFRSTAEKRLEEFYGTEKDPALQRIHAAENVWNSLNAAQRAEVLRQLNARNVVPMARPRGAARVVRPILQLANADSQTLLDLRREARVGTDPVFTQPLRMEGDEREATSYSSELDRLIIHRRIENQQIKQRLSTSAYDPEQQRVFLRELKGSHQDISLPPGVAGPLNRIQGQEIHDLYTNILENNALVRIKNNPPAQALIHKLWELRQSGNLLQMRQLLSAIQADLPNVEIEEEPTPEGEQSEEQEKADKQKSLGKELVNSRNKLQELYLDARSNASQLEAINSDITAARGAAGGGGAGNRDTGLSELFKQKQKVMAEKADLLKKIRSLESTHKVNMKEVKKLLGSASIPGITDFRDDIEFSTESELFTSVTPPALSAFQQHIKALPEDKLTEIGSAQRQRLKPQELLFRLHLEEEKERYGDHVTTDMLDRAQTRAMADVTRVLNVPIDRATNRELAEKVNATTWQAFKKIWAAKYSDKTVYTTGKILTGLTQKGSGLERFADIGPSMTDEQIHVWLDENPEVDTKELNTYVLKLQDVLKNFRYDGGKVELLDSDALELRQYIGRLQNIENVRRMFASGFEGKITPDSNVVHEATTFSNELLEAEEEEQKGIVETLKDKFKAVGRWISGKLFRREKNDFVKQIINEKMGQKEAMSLLETLGLASVPSAIAAAHGAVNIAQNGAWYQRGWKKASAVPSKVGGVAKRGWGGAKKVSGVLGKTLYVITAPVWWPAKKIGQGGMWVGRKSWGGVKAVGRGLKKFWDWV